MSNDKVADLMKNQKLFSNKDLMTRNLGQLAINLDECKNYIEDVREGRLNANEDIIKSLNSCIS